jgi:opacity protein-like surface antigen
MKNIFLVIASLFVMLTSAGFAQAADESNPIPAVSEAWRFEVTPYLWAPGIKGTLGLDNGLAKSADFTSTDVVNNLKSGGMISAEAHKGQWGLMGDIVSATLQKSGAIPVQGGTATLGDKVTLQQTILTGLATYTVLNNKDAYVDALLGVRAIYATATVNVNVVGTPYKASIAKTSSTVDPIVGAKGRYRIADSTWYLPFYADIGSGGGTTNLTWQAMAGVGKTFNQLIDASLTYRALYYDMKDGGVLQKTTMLGPQVAVTFKF